MSVIQTSFVTQPTASSLNVPYTQVIDPVTTISTITHTAIDPDDIGLNQVNPLIPIRPIEVHVPPPVEIPPRIPNNPPSHKKSKEEPEIDIEIPENDNGSAANMSFPIFGIIFLAFASVFNSV
ncbi:hypothetical protein FVEN_g3766 [Fusarium venenatum]|uniref:Uncharacterized protein n=1 Tax=Fusarium venenatum TaxID=56646 RepID=A0A2L2TKT6_9HYPO|nr:uncharacterized protein FVRRES_13738 [Fusarium venenatum]KAG8358734.1 hypothetical protein FVEN_g3766 [Fusarium venenatum]CEI41778.1 unnamed protein product [Fusarium venenatum]